MVTNNVSQSNLSFILKKYTTNYQKSLVAHKLSYSYNHVCIHLAINGCCRWHFVCSQRGIWHLITGSSTSIFFSDPSIQQSGDLKPTITLFLFTIGLKWVAKIKPLWLSLPYPLPIPARHLSTRTATSQMHAWLHTKSPSTTARQ